MEPGPLYWKTPDIIVFHYIYNEGGKLSPQCGAFLTRCLLIAFKFLTDVQSRLEWIFDNLKMFVCDRRMEL